ncbi:MAG: hypothetical protein QOC79_2459, partial [Actinomycetota bacterium]|nr:hypothetical protein [Actinomycetota bacterium]
AASRSDHLLGAGSDRLSALVGGYHLAFIVGAVFAAGAAALGVGLLRVGQAPAYDGEPASAEV